MAETPYMTEFPQIFDTDIVNAETDVFWHSEKLANKQLNHNEVLVLTSEISPNSQEEIQLNKILDACKLSNVDYHLVSFSTDEKIAWHQLKNSVKPTKVITFGINPARMGITALFRLNAVNHFDGVVIIPTLSLQELEQQPQAKKDLWLNALKPVFVDK